MILVERTFNAPVLEQDPRENSVLSPVLEKHSTHELCDGCSHVCISFTEISCRLSNSVSIWVRKTSRNSIFYQKSEYSGPPSEGISNTTSFQPAACPNSIPPQRISCCPPIPVCPPVEGTTALPVKPSHRYSTGIFLPHPENLIRIKNTKTMGLKRLLDRCLCN